MTVSLHVVGSMAYSTPTFMCPESQVQHSRQSAPGGPVQRRRPVRKSPRSKKRLTSRRTQKIPAPLLTDATRAPTIPPVAKLATARRAIRSDIDGLSAVLDALGRRQLDLYDVSDAEWQKMSPRQQAELVRHQNQRQALNHNLGPTYVGSSALKDAVTHAHELYVAMTPEQRRTVLHPRHLDQWLADRRVVTIVARDFNLGAPLPGYLLPKSYRISDEGPSSDWLPPVYLTISINLDAPLESVAGELRNLIAGLHAPTTRRPRRRSSTRRSREKYDDDQLAAMIQWYYRRAAGEPLKELAIKAAGQTVRHVAAAQSKILRQLRWFRRELGIA